MSDSITIAIDAMGGDRAPEMVLRGADIALERYPGAQFLLFGDAAQITPLLGSLPRLMGAARVHHTDEAVADDAKPSQALRGGRQSSMRLAIDAVAMALSFEVFFVRLLKVQMPAGLFKQWLF